MEEIKKCYKYDGLTRSWFPVSGAGKCTRNRPNENRDYANLDSQPEGNVSKVGS